MKFPFFRSKTKVVTGAVIKTPQIHPWHASALREAREHNQIQKRMYDAAVTSNLNADFPGTFGSANAEMLTSLYIARARARTLVKDNPTAKGINRTFKNNTVGDDPFRLEMKVGSWSADGKTFTPEVNTNREIEQAWKEFGKPKNFTVRGDMSRMEALQIAESEALCAGSMIFRHHRGFKSNKFGYAVELVETDRLQESYQGKSEEGNAIRFSIERDSTNRPLYYWILSRNPGDLFAYNGPVPNTYRERVPASDIIMFNNLRDRAEQDIGFPEFDSVIQQLHRDRQFDIAHVTAAIWACAKPYFIIQEYPTGMPYTGDPNPFYNEVGGPVNSANQTGNGLAGGDGRGGGANKIKAVEPGTGEILNFGQKPMLVDPKFPVESAHNFKTDIHRSVAAGMGLGYHTVSCDYEKLSFSSARAAEQPQRDYFMVRQENMKVIVVEEIFGEWLKSAILTGQIKQSITRLEEFKAAATFQGKRWPYINPMQDAQTDIMLIESHLKSRQEVLTESVRGGNFGDVIAQIAAEEEMAESHDIDLNPEVTKPTIPKGDPGTTQPPKAGDGADTTEPAAKKTGRKVKLLTDRTRQRTLQIEQLNGHH